MKTKKLLPVLGICMLAVFVGIVIFKSNRPAQATAMTDQPTPPVTSANPVKPVQTAPIALRTDNPGISRSVLSVPMVRVPAAKDGGLIAYQANELLMMADQHPEVGLTVGDLKKSLPIFLDAYVHLQELENGLAIQTKTTPMETVIEIPAYASEGEKIESELYAKLEQALGKAKVMLIRDALLGPIARLNNSWGQAPQTLSFQKEGELYRITQSIGTHSLTGIVKEMTGLEEKFIVARNKPGSIVTKDDLGQYAIKAVFFPKG
ncbi:MAG: hypothetical protein JWO00_693 [Candidatus Parcubacteria bacterium]|nr:hypothetical protein [Candidatus Parcubacteria bacterium]